MSEVAANRAVKLVREGNAVSSDTIADADAGVRLFALRFDVVVLADAF